MSISDYGNPKSHRKSNVFGLSQSEKDKALFTALYYGRTKDVLKALERGANPNTVYSRDYDAPLFQACRLRDEEESEACITALLAKGADVNKRDDDGRTPLQTLMVRNNRYDGVMDRLIAAGSDMNAVDDAGNTVLMTAISYAAWNAAEKLIKAGADVKARGKNGQSPMLAAVERNAPVSLLDKLTETDFNQTYKGGQPALVRAAVNGSKKHVEWLLKKPGLQIDIQGPIESGNDRGPTVKRSALQVAVVNGKKDLCEMLLAAGAKPDLADGEGHTPLCVAVAADNHDIAEMLLKAKAKIAIPSGDRQAPLEIASRAGSIRMVKTLLAAAEASGEKLNLDAALAAASEKGHGRVIELLIAAGGDVNAADIDQRTPLMKAALSDQIEVLSILIKAGAKTDAPDRHGMQAYDHAVSNGKGKAKEYLSRYRTGKVKEASPPQGETTSEDYRYTRLNDHSLEVREGDSLTITFNFWTQQVLIRDTERPAPVTVQNFNDIQRQEAIEEAFRKLKELGGNPPEPNAVALQKRPGLTKQ